MNDGGARDYRPTEAEPLRDVAEQAKAAGRQAQEAASDAANASAEAIKAHASRAVDAAKDIASSAQDRFQDKVAEQKNRSAELPALPPTLRMRCARPLVILMRTSLWPAPTCVRPPDRSIARRRL